ncbi:hypothetical protein [Kriegella aquimaris]|uniref:Collagen triple helix repeat-containing protein n=1 Tax=Kriegella aquimaris TaxID=192904 RepID=A0A1G9WXN3_9FLAO|nr:hypothetical protein [Kriegella aquimaris]SDM89262.1 hypothetical protein SAMN04488514_116104 [Kriegella aquimaris]
MTQSCSVEYGIDGMDGAQGPQGLHGEQGIKGENGNANVIASEWTQFEWNSVNNGSLGGSLVEIPKLYTLIEQGGSIEV